MNEPQEEIIELTYKEPKKESYRWFTSVDGQVIKESYEIRKTIAKKEVRLRASGYSPRAVELYANSKKRFLESLKKIMNIEDEVKPKWTKEAQDDYFQMHLKRTEIDQKIQSRFQQKTGEERDVAM